MSGLSLHAGVSRGVAGRLRSPAVDARDLAAAAAVRGFGVQRVLIDPTCDLFLNALAAAVERTRRGDTLLITFSGHGREGTWCFADGDLPLARIADGLPRFGYVCIVSDACHSAAWREVAMPAGAEVMLVAPEERHPSDGRGINTRSAFTAELIRALREGRSIRNAPLTRLSPQFEPFRIAADAFVAVEPLVARGDEVG